MIALVVVWFSLSQLPAGASRLKAMLMPTHLQLGKISALSILKASSLLSVCCHFEVANAVPHSA